MARRDYYAVLGVPRSASTDDVKKAFRTLALKHHPDRNPGDAEAERRFREAAEAWAVLGDAEQRARFDRMGPLFTPSGRPPNPDEVNDALRDALNGLFRRRRPEGPGEDLKYTVSMTLEDVAKGSERSLNVARMVRCRPCDGSGDDPAGRTPCLACAGSGKSPTRRLFRTECAQCNGKGYKPSAKCERCRGETRHAAEELLKIKIPAGVATGQKLKLRGKGNDPVPAPGVPGGAPGDLYVLVNVEEHALFRRRGPDLLIEVPVSYAEATLGAELVVPTLDGTTTIKMPGGTPSGRSFRLAGRGLAGEERTKGDLHVKVVVEIPAALDEDARLALVAYAERAGASAHPQRRAYAEALRGRR